MKRILFMLSICLLALGCKQDVTKIDLTGYTVKIKDNTVFYKNDTLDYHKNSFVIIKTDSSGTASELNFDPKYVTTFNTTTVGPSKIVFTFGSYSVSKDINVNDDNLVFKSNDSGITIETMLTEGDELIVPKYYKGQLVTKIDAPFVSGTSVKSVLLPDSITEIGANTFSYTDITSINLPQNLEKIGSEAFYYSKLESITIPSNVNFIGSKAFACNNFNKIIINSSSATIEKYAFLLTENSVNVLIPQEYNTKENLIYIFCFLPSTVNNIPNQFTETYSVEILDNTVFYKDDTIDYHKNSFKIVQTDKDGNTTEIDFDPSYIVDFDTSEIGDSKIFFNINGYVIVKDIYINNDGLIYTENSSDNSIAITNFPLITEHMVIPKYYKGYLVTALEKPCFNNNKVIKTVSIPDSVTHIGETFTKSSLEELVIPDSVETITQGAFFDSEISKLTIGSSLTEIPVNGFGNCKLEEVEIPGNIKKIGSLAFHNNRLSESIVLHEGLETIGNYAFGGTLINDLVIPGTVKTIETDAFSGAKFTNVKIKAEELELGDNSLLLKDKFSEIEIPDNFNNDEEIRRVFGLVPITINGIPTRLPQFKEEEYSDFFMYYSRIKSRYSEYNLTKCADNYDIWIHSKNDSSFAFDFSIDDSQDQDKRVVFKAYIENEDDILIDDTFYFDSVNSALEYIYLKL